MVKFEIRAILLLIMSLLVSCGPGVSDYKEHIENGYYYSDAGHYEKVIFKNDIIIDAKVTGWLLNDGNLYVSRNPRLIYKEGNVTKSKLSNKCELWLINIQKNVVTGPYSNRDELPLPELPSKELDNLKC